MSRRIVGAGVLCLLVAAILAGATAIAMQSTTIALGYLAIVAVTTPVLVYSYCGKCPAADDCSHIVPAILVRVLPARAPGPYAPPDYVVTVSIVVAWLGTPLPWLLARPWLLAAYAALVAVAVLLMARVVCPGCGNTCCPACPRRAEPAES